MVEVLAVFFTTTLSFRLSALPCKVSNPYGRSNRYRLYSSYLTLFALTFTVPLSSEDFAKEGIFLKPRVLLNSNEVWLKDISNFHEKTWNIKIFSNLISPKILSINELEKILVSNNISEKVFGKNSILIPFTKEFTKSELEESLLSEISSKSGIEKSELKITYNGKKINLPESGVEFRWANFPKNLISGRRIFPLDIYFQNEKIHTVRLNFLLEKKITAVVSKRKISKGKILSKNDFEIRSFYSEEDNKDLFSEDVTGFTVLGEIEENKPIRKKEIRNSFLVEKGSEVTIVFTKGNLVVKGKSRARTSGNLGDLVQVNGHSNHSILTARVADRGSVIIE